MPLLHPSQRKSFTINKDTCLTLARRLANGENLRFQSVANRNWVAKEARKLGAVVDVRVSRDTLINPRYTVEGADLPDLGMGNDKQYMTLYVAERAYATVNPSIDRDYDTPFGTPKPIVHVGPYSRYTGFGYTR
jgi:hypothetical protein